MKSLIARLSPQTKLYYFYRFISVVVFSLLFHAGNVTAQNTQFPRIIFATQYGNIIIELNTKSAPISSNNFLSYVKEGYFDGLSFYRTVNHANDNHELKIAILQGGLNANFDEPFSPALAPISHESTMLTGLKHTRGAVSFARGDIGSAQTEFFISIDDNPALDAEGLRHPDKQGFAVFGRVIEGMQVVDEIAALPAHKKHPDPYAANQILSESVPIAVTQIE